MSAITNAGAKIAIIAGGGGQTANELKRQLLVNGYQIINLTRTLPKTAPLPGIWNVAVPSDKPLTERDFHAAIGEGMRQMGVPVSKISRLAGFNLIGGAVAPPGGTLKLLNYEIPLAFLEALVNVGEEAGVTTSAANLSSIATAYKESGSEYAKIRGSLNEAIQETSFPHGGRGVSFCPSLVAPAADKDNIVNMGHAYSPEQFANVPLVPVLGSGKQVMQPVTEEDLMKAVVRAVGEERAGGGNQIVNAVGLPQDALTQTELMTLFNRHICMIVHIPYEIAREVATTCPFGRIAPYSVEIMETQDLHPEWNRPFPSDAFIEELGETPTGIRKLYKGKDLILSSPCPLIEHSKKILKLPREKLVHLFLTGVLNFPKVRATLHIPENPQLRQPE